MTRARPDADDVRDAARRHEGRCRALSTAAQWTFDPVFCAVSASIERGAAADVAARLAQQLPVALDKKALRAATAAQKDVAMWAGGVEGKQRLFVDADPGPVALFATIWPWTEDEGCTVRVGLYASDARAPEREALGTLLRAWFAAT
jgi:hypothetical protein